MNCVKLIMYCKICNQTIVACYEQNLSHIMSNCPPECETLEHFKPLAFEIPSNTNTLKPPICKGKTDYCRDEDGNVKVAADEDIFWD
jgi:hypothetical protein